MRLSELDELYEQAMRHALYAEQNGSLSTARALQRVALEIEQERQDLLASNPLRLEPDHKLRSVDVPTVARG